MATYYFDFDNGSDSNDGSTPALALKNLCGTVEATGNAIFNPNAGDNLYLARGSRWNVSTNWFFAVNDEGAEGNPVNIDAYDRTGETGQAKPIVESFFKIDSGDWTADVTYTSTWWADLGAGTTACFRCFFNLVGQKPATSIANCNATAPWYFDNAADRLYVYSGSPTNNPTTVYGDVWCDRRITTGNVGTYVLFIQRCSHLRFNNIAFWGGSDSNVAIKNNLLATDTGDVHITNCDMLYSGKSGVVLGTSIAQFFIDDIIIENNYMDTKRTTNENIDVEVAGDGIQIDGGANYNVYIRNNTVVDFPHSGIVAYTLSGGIISQGIIISNNDVSCPTLNYGRGISTSGFTTEIKDVLVTGNYIHNTVVRNQYEGKNIYVIGNIIDTVSGTTIAPAGRGHGISSVARSNTNVENVVIANNLIKNCNDHSIRLEDTATYPITSYSCYNNICIQENGKTETLLYVENDTRGTLAYENNVFYSSAGTEEIDFDGVVYSQVAADAAISEFTNNQSSDPILNGYVPDPYNTNLYHTGKPLGFAARDFKGHKFSNPPSIGAYELAGSRMPAKTGRNRR